MYKITHGQKNSINNKRKETIQPAELIHMPLEIVIHILEITILLEVAPFYDVDLDNNNNFLKLSYLL